MIHLYIGSGKGKTTAAVGLALRAKGSGKDVCFMQFLKGGCSSGENKMLKKAGIDVIRFSQRHPMFCAKVSIPELKQKISQDLKKAAHIIKEKKYSVIILDEILYALKNKFIRENDVLKIIKSTFKNNELILTGNYSTTKIAKTADYISNIQDVKHPYRKGVKARMGVEI